MQANSRKSSALKSSSLLNTPSEKHRSPKRARAPPYPTFDTTPPSPLSYSPASSPAASPYPFDLATQRTSTPSKPHRAPRPATLSPRPRPRPRRSLHRAPRFHNESEMHAQLAHVRADHPPPSPSPADASFFTLDDSSDSDDSASSPGVRLHDALRGLALADIPRGDVGRGDGGECDAFFADTSFDARDALNCERDCLSFPTSFKDYFAEDHSADTLDDPECSFSSCSGGDSFSFLDRSFEL